jgi:hypothetical protein
MVDVGFIGYLERMQASVKLDNRVEGRYLGVKCDRRQAQEGHLHLSAKMPSLVTRVFHEGLKDAVSNWADTAL